MRVKSKVFDRHAVITNLEGVCEGLGKRIDGARKGTKIKRERVEAL